MIYGFIKEGNKYISKDEQRKEIEQFVQSKGLAIDRYIIDDYKINYMELHNLKRGLGRVTSLYNLNSGDILICSNFYVLGYSYKAVLFIIKTALEQGVKIYSAEEGIELNKKHLKPVSIIYDIKSFFDNKRHESLFKTVWNRCKLDPFKSEIEILIHQGISITKIAKKYKVHFQTVHRFLDKNPELKAIYKKTNHSFDLESRKKTLLEKRPFLRTQIDRYIRKVRASIVPTKTLLLAEELKGEN